MGAWAIPAACDGSASNDLAAYHLASGNGMVSSVHLYRLLKTILEKHFTFARDLRY
jgi:hypothetical protein